MSDKDLILYLPLDEVITDGKTSKFRDSSPLQRHGELKGNVSLITDDSFGACASFDGKPESYIEIADSPELQIAGDITVEAWVNIAAAPTDWVRFVGKGATDKRNYGLWYHRDKWLFQRNQNCEKQQSPTLNDWLHVAGTLQGNAASLYLHDLEGKLSFKQDVTWSGLPATSNDPLRIGYAGFYKAHAGRIAAVRVYRRALSKAEIERDIRLDCMRLVAFRKSHPIDFRLYDDDEQAVLYISEDAFGHNLSLELRNTSPQIIQLSDGQNAGASEENHHFALRFRPGTLSENMLKRLVNPQERAKILAPANAADWELYFPAKPPAANEAAVLYLRYKGAKKSFDPNELRRLTLQHVSAAPGSGARGAQVELLPRQLSVAGDDPPPITGSRTQYVHIANQRGRKNIPLHVGFVGGNAVINDNKSENTLRLRITNVSKEGEITLNANTSSSPTKFIVYFDVEEKRQTKEWALVTSTHAKNVKVTVDGRKIDPEGAGETEGETPKWPITFDTAHRIAAGHHLQIALERIVSSLPSGHANLYVRYENIPGYWDGQFVCTVEKGPIVCDDKGYVGIGTIASNSKVEVKGDFAAERLSLAGLNVDGHVGVSAPRTNYQLDVKSSTPIKLGLEGGGGGQLLIANEKNDNKIYLEALSSDAKGHAAEFLLTGKDGAAAPKLTLRAGTTHISGNVGIGTITPAAKLAVKGGLHVGGDSDPGENNLLVDGQLLLGEATVGQDAVSNHKGLQIKNASLRVQEGIAVGSDSNFLRWITKRSVEKRDLGSFAVGVPRGGGSTAWDRVRASHILQNIDGNLKKSCAFQLDLSEQMSILSLSGSYQARFSLRVRGNETPFFQGGSNIVSANVSVAGNVLTVSCPRESMLFPREVEQEIDMLILPLDLNSRIEVELEPRFSAFVVYAK